VPKLSRAARYGYYKFCRKTGEFAEASAAAVFDPEKGSARGSISPRCARCPSRSRRSRAIAEAASDVDPVERRMAAAVTARALQQERAAQYRALHAAVARGSDPTMV
jgi:carbon-monoxide dehydrogenase medium subunit